MLIFKIGMVVLLFYKFHHQVVIKILLVELLRQFFFDNLGIKWITIVNHNKGEAMSAGRLRDAKIAICDVSQSRLVVVRAP